MQIKFNFSPIVNNNVFYQERYESQALCEVFIGCTQRSVSFKPRMIEFMWAQLGQYAELPTLDVENVCQPLRNPQNDVRIMKWKNNSFDGLAFTFVSCELFSQITKLAGVGTALGEGEVFFQIYEALCGSASVKFELRQKLGRSKRHSR